MTEQLGFSNNPITVYKYEPFSYTISNPYYPPLVPTTAVSTGIPPSLVVTTPSNVVFSSVSGYGGSTSSNESIVITAGSNVSSNTVSINPGRFRDVCGISMSNTVFTFYKNEPITPTAFNSSIALQTPLLTFPALPAGLSFTEISSTQFMLSGTPLAQLPARDYQIIGQGSNSDSGKIVTTTNSMTVNGERIQFNLSGSPIVSHMEIDTPISQRSLYATFPLATTGNLKYTWDPLPTGLYFGNFAGMSQASGFQPLDASYTLTLQGTPTLGAAKAFAAAGLSNYTVNVYALRLTSPNISNSTFYTFQFDPTVLFDDVSIPTYYANSALNPTQTYFSAKTYFGSDASISDIFSPDLRSDLSMTFVSEQARAYLTGTPLTASTATYTIRASNVLGVTRDLSVPITVLNSNVSFDYSVTPIPTDACYNFILSRPVSLLKPGYYSSNVQFKVTTLPSNIPITLTASGLAGTGIVISNISSNLFQLTGTPTTITPLTTVTVTASSLDGLATASTTIKLAVLNDRIKFEDVSALAFVQNREITPVQIVATTTLSDRPITGYSAANLPTGLSISPGGLITGTPLTSASGTATFTATTGYVSDVCSIPFAMIPDSMLFVANPNVYQYSPSANVVIDIDAFAYSGKVVSNYVFSNFTPSYGLSIDSSSGIITGTLPDGMPPDSLLPVSKDFNVKASAGTLTGNLTAHMTTTNAILNRSYTFEHFVGMSTLYIADTSNLNDWSTAFIYGGWFTDFQIKNTSIDSNTFLICDAGNSSASGSVVWHSSNGVDFTPNGFGTISDSYSAYKAVNVSNTPTWYIGGTSPGGNNLFVTLFKSVDDGITWNLHSTISNMSPRQGSVVGKYYSTKGVAFGYASNGYFMMGGGYSNVSSRLMARSIDGGTTWGNVANTLSTEVGNFSLDGPVWVATGSSDYSSGEAVNSFPNAAKTLNWSENQGRDWYAATGDFDLIGFEVAYASNTWLSSGLSRVSTSSIQTRLLCSTDGKTWSNVTLPTTFTTYPETHLPEISSIWFDGLKWNTMVKMDNPSLPDYTCLIYTHDLSSSLTSGWTVLDPAGAVPFMGNPDVTLSTFKQQYVRSGIPTTVTVSFDTLSASGPVFTSPSSSSFIENQYIAIQPIQLSATGVGQVYFFVTSADLPQGLEFSPTTNQISGIPVRLGNSTVPVYAKDNNGVRKLTLDFTVVLPRVIRTQSSASAYTSLVRQYTVVNAAQNARDNRVFPEVDRILGEFTAPYPPDVTTQKVNPNCFNPECK